jgi:predicted DNA-binding protein
MAQSADTSSGAVVKEIRSRCAGDPSRSGTGFHFCSLDVAASQRAVNVFSSILAQLVRLKPELVERVRPLRKPSDNILPLSSLTLQVLKETLQYGLSLVQDFYILVDALNETQDQDQIVSLLLNLSQSCPNVRILVTCTSDPRSENGQIFVQRMAVHAVDHDIAAYVDYRLTNEPAFSALRPQVKDKIRIKMAEGADGT